MFTFFYLHFRVPANFMKCDCVAALYSTLVVAVHVVKVKMQTASLEYH